MVIHQVRDFAEYQAHRERMQAVYEERWKFEQSLQPKVNGPFKVAGFSYPAGKEVEFKADFEYSDGQNVNWRERLVCPVTGLNNRLRAAVHIAETELGLATGAAAYITEQVTPLFDFLRLRYPSLVGSEFLGNSVPLGDSDQRGVRNEDLTKLTFSANQFDVVLSFDCFEHMPDFPGGMREMARVTRPGGRMMWSVPFRADLANNLRRASRDPDGNIVHHEPPEYHGDPINSAGCLCFTHFGWEMLDQVKQAGFDDAYAVAYWSDSFGYLGLEQFVFVAFK
jgi:SAM-dependent methyltransferase